MIFDESFLAPLHRHFINLMCVDSGAEAKKRNQGKPALYNFSAFIVEIDNRWFAVTAGHIFSKLKIAQAKGSNISNWRIDDSILSSNPMPAYPISIDIDKDVLWLNDDIPGIDYACFEINHLTRQALSAQGIQAIPSHIWSANDVLEYSTWLLIGTPTCFTELDIEKPIIKHHATIRLKHVKDIPSNLQNTQYQRIYALVDFSSIISPEDSFDIDGMSGGPIFGLKPSTASNQYEYRIIGVQSSWDGVDHVAICAAQPFIRAFAQSACNQRRTEGA